MPSRLLAPHHREMLRASAISDEAISARGYWTATTKADLLALGFKEYQANVPALVVPGYTTDGRNGHNSTRPDRPRVRDGKPIKAKRRGRIARLAASPTWPTPASRSG
jgi:hypothetical protein